MHLHCRDAPQPYTPPSFFCSPDEPTSGLDSVTALSLCSTLRELAQNKKCTILCTIHQPSATIFSLFDSLILLQVPTPCP
jgi:ABC-type multidrug transport system ATPase subunit